MARLPRFDLPGQPQHVIQRGNNRSVIFVADEDYQFYLEKLNAACQKYECDLHAYVLMTNHVHLLITPHHTGAIGKVMQMLGRYYVQYFNRQYQRTGTLWEGRYKATVLDSDQYLLVCSRYIELNPVRAGMVRHPGDYPWSSYHFNAFGKENALLSPHPLYLALGNDATKRQEVYQELFEQHVTESTIKEIRDATNKAWVLGGGRFQEEVERLLQRQAKPKPRGGNRRSKKARK
ncbi:transposase [Methylomarinum vadi]|uniref:transposase n=1 Tax=Methylomarinum vadi TaxID=438855 RepID=UPI0004DEF694|nr:transposase [Methylomarinum vadi]